MFDIGFLEILFVSIVALLVMGPERLPEAIRTASLWIGRLRRGFQDIKRDIEREVGADEIKQTLHNESILKSLEQVKADIEHNLAKASEALRKDAAKLQDDIEAATEPQKNSAKASPAETPDDPVIESDHSPLPDPDEQLEQEIPQQVTDKDSQAQ